MLLTPFFIDPKKPVVLTAPTDHPSMLQTALPYPKCPSKKTREGNLEPTHLQENYQGYRFFFAASCLGATKVLGGSPVSQRKLIRKWTETNLSKSEV